MNFNLDETTFVKLLKTNAERYGDRKTALRSKARGIWQEISWKRYYENVKSFSLGLTCLGVNTDDTVAVIGNNRPASLFTVIGIQAAGGLALCLYQDSTPAELAVLLERFNVRYVVAEGQEQVDKILDIKDRLCSLAGVIYCDPRGMRHYREEHLHSFDTLSRNGNLHDDQHPGDFEKRIARGTGDDVAVICITSGTTGDPKGALLSFRNLLSMAGSLNQVDPKHDKDEFVSFLPMAWFGEQMISLASALSIGFTVNFPEKPETVMADLREIGPHIIYSPPRIWESIASSVQVRIMDTTPFKRLMYKTFMPVGERVAALQLSGRPVPLITRIQYALAHVCLFRALRDRLGLSRVRTALTGGSPLGPDVFKFFHSIGVNLKQVYGLTEVAGISCIHLKGDIQGATVGMPLPGTEVAISEEGEILLKGDGTFKGYYKDDTATSAALKGGWLHSGDAGYLQPNGHLVVIDRLHDVLKLTNGSNCAPQFVESKLKFSPYIREAVVIGNGRPHLTALVCIDGRIVGKWAGDNKIPYTTYSDLTSKPEVADFIVQELARVNRELPETARIRRLALLYKDLDADEEELTRTGKVRRELVAHNYREIIEGLYQDVASMPVDVSIALQDGKSARIKTTVHFRDL